MPVAVILGVPMYGNAAGLVPVIQVFVAKGVSISYSNCIHDGFCRIILTRSYNVEKGYDSKAYWYILWNDIIIHNNLGTSILYCIIELLIQNTNKALLGKSKLCLILYMVPTLYINVFEYCLLQFRF